MQHWFAILISFVTYYHTGGLSSSSGVVGTLSPIDCVSTHHSEQLKLHDEDQSHQVSMPCFFILNYMIKVCRELSTKAELLAWKNHRDVIAIGGVGCQEQCPPASTNRNSSSSTGIYIMELANVIVWSTIMLNEETRYAWH